MHLDYSLSYLNAVIYVTFVKLRPFYFCHKLFPDLFLWYNKLQKYFLWSQKLERKDNQINTLLNSYQKPPTQASKSAQDHDNEGTCIQVHVNQGTYC